MATQAVSVEIKGLSALLMHAFPMAPIEAVEKKTPEEQARLAEYRNPDGMLYIPSVAVQRALVSGATYSKGKGRGNLSRPVAACVIVSPEYLIITPQTYVVDSRPVVIPATKGRVLRHRPKFEQWSIVCQIEWDDTLLKESEIRRVVDDTCSRVGFLDFRPEKRGPFGRSMVVAWKKIT